MFGGQPLVQRHPVGDEVVGQQRDAHVRDDGGRDARGDAPQPIPGRRGRGTRGLRPRGAAARPRPRGRADRARQRWVSGARAARGLLSGGLDPDRGRGGRAAPARGCRARAQHPPAVRVARAGGGPRGGGADGAAAAQLPPLLRDRGRLPRRRAVLSLPRARHAARVAAALPRLARRGRRVRRRSRPPAAAPVRASPTRSCASVDASAARLAELGLPAGRDPHAAQLRAHLGAG